MKEVGAGEILVNSPAVMSGYLNRPDLTGMVLSGGWLRTGDHGKVDDRGWIWLAGRINDQINRAGFKVQPAEIDALLERHPAVAEACVFGLTDPISGQIVAAAVRFVEGANANIKALQSWCLRHSRREAVPERWFVVDAIPRTNRGKVSRDEVRRSLASFGSRAGSEAGQRTAVNFLLPAAAEFGAHRSVRRAVEQAWATVLGEPALAANISWEEAGGDSLNCMQLWFLLESQLSLRLPLELVTPKTTVDELTISIAKAWQSSFSALGRTDRLPIMFFLPPRGAVASGVGIR